MTSNDFGLRRWRRPLPSRPVNVLTKSFLLLSLVLVACLALQAQPQPGDSAVIPAAPVVTEVTTNETEAQLLRNFLIVQDQLRATQQAVEKTREQALADAKRSEEALTARLNLIEQTLSSQRATELASMQKSTRTMILLACIITVAGFIAVLFAGFVQARAMIRLTDVSRQLRAALPPTPLEGGNALLLSNGSVDNSNAHLLHAIERLERRLEDVESVGAATHTATNGHKPVAASAPVPAMNPQITTLLGKGQALLNLDKAEDALEHFEKAIQIDSNNIEAWIKKGTALERLQRIDEAIAAYDQAIAVDSSTATAYLFKAGVYNRQKKYAEALQCYEKALNAQQKSRTQTARA